ncbi:MAG: hypothetical protein COB07_04135 [Sulfurovum sp.]|nr:MAG: hypothetical protein COB07_04135 [Sulfurovum sp.]
MKKHHFISITLIISGLALNPLIANTTVKRATQTQSTNHTISASIASILHHRGIDEETAEEISNNLLEEDETLLAMMQNLEEVCSIVSREEVLEYLSTAALHRQNVRFDSYDQLIAMVSKIKQTSLDTKTLQNLRDVAKKNALLVG